MNHSGSESDCTGYQWVSLNLGQCCLQLLFVACIPNWESKLYWSYSMLLYNIKHDWVLLSALTFLPTKSLWRTALYLWAEEEKQYWTISTGFIISLQKFRTSSLPLTSLYVPFLVFFPRFPLLSEREEWMSNKKGVRVRKMDCLTNRGTKVKQEEEIKTGRGTTYLWEILNHGVST